ncbi:MAG TPA: PstS family phosphate ABC transporter substrate-binding protein [Thermoanaerobaculia bacterium]|jgi:phosphate transport system substrate-binding protein|nr:PstS family phosphate ABC transporter substrate-binding protein [Thermoanaerobaculia bacterium]
MKQAGRIVFTLVLCAALAACGGREPQQTSTDGTTQPRASNKPLTVKGSDTMVILTQRLAEEYMKAHPGEVVQVNGGGSGTGIAALINGSIDMAMASRPMKDDEKQKAAQSRGSEVVEHPVALDALGVFVNSTNPVQQLTIAQIRDIFQGKTKNWSAFGGPNAQIILYGRESSSGTYDYFREHVLDKGDFAPQVQTLQGTAAIINAVGNDKNGIGYGGIAYAKEVRALAVQAEGAQPVAPSEASVADGTYPLSRKLFFYYPGGAPERVTKFAQWSITPEAQALVTKVGYFPLNTRTQ